MMSWFIFILPLVLITIWTFKYLLVPRVRTHKCASQIRNLLNPPDIALDSLLRARAQPNQRLVQAFGLTSTFVSGDAKIHKSFTTRAKALISSAGEKDEKWRAVAYNAEVTAHRFLPGVQQTIEFSTFIQCVTFVVVLCTLFDTDLDALHYDDLVYVTNIINQRWKDSKIKDAATMRRDDSLRKMMAYIDQWIVDRHLYPNPLNFILPAYETMWRVVAVTVAYIYRCRDNTLQDIAIAFSKNPTEARFEAFEDHGLQPSMQAIVLEVLRLHPPTRHIARAPIVSETSWSWWRSLVAPAVELADIEAVHLSDTYGENPSAFEPMRFHPLRVPADGRTLYAFGHGRLKCVAAAWAPMAAAVIAAKVVAQIEDAGCTLTIGDKIGGRSGWDGWSIGKRME